jgi:glycosyltransferase involved in cell wall biosynthesis
MPTYNGARYLRHALQSIADQDDGGIEVIAVDDGSTDATPAILQEFSCRLNMRVVARSHRGNWVANTNLAFSMARGDYLCILHQDDLWLPGRARLLRNAVRRWPNVGLLLHSARFIDPRGRQVGTWRCPLPTHGRPLASETVMASLMVQNYFAMPSPCFKRSLVERVGPMNETLLMTGDWDFWLRLAAAGQTLFLEETLAAFRVHPEAQTIKFAKDPVTYRREHLDVLRNHASRLTSLGKGTGSLLRLAEISVEVNAALAGLVHRRRGQLWRLLRLCCQLTPLDWWRFLRYSRIHERTASRLRAGMTAALAS